jgi:hypothetical protein
MRAAAVAPSDHRHPSPSHHPSWTIDGLCVPPPCPHPPRYRHGQWSWTPTADFVTGIHQVTAEAVEASGNVSPVSPAARVVVSAAPVISVFAAASRSLALP